MNLELAIIEASIQGYDLSPKTTKSSKYQNWISIDDKKRCVECEKNHGKIYSISESPNPKPPTHMFCRCVIEAMQAIVAGTATIHGNDGADWTLLYKKELPEYYITKEEALVKGWNPGKWPSNFISDKVITNGVYENRNGHLPHKPGRVWHEADINYRAGKRNNQRVVWSNDGLVFVTYDHYTTFYEIV